MDLADAFADYEPLTSPFWVAFTYPWTGREEGRWQRRRKRLGTPKWMLRRRRLVSGAIERVRREIDGR